MKKHFRCGVVGKCKEGGYHDHPLYGYIKVDKIEGGFMNNGRLEYIVLASQSDKLEYDQFLDTLKGNSK